MREIKYKAWDGKKMLPVTALYPMMRPNTGIACRVADGTADQLIFAEAILQYTGLKDKNGREIYECDVVLCDGKQRTIKWANGKFWFVIESTNQHEDISEIFDRYYDKVYKIGSIYENPNLIEK